MALTVAWVMLAAVVTTLITLAGAAPTSASAVTTTYDVAVYTYDTPVRLSTPHTPAEGRLSALALFMGGGVTWIKNLIDSSTLFSTQNNCRPEGA